MKKLVHRLRRHPHHIRQKMLFVAMAVSGAVLFGLWLLSFSYVAHATPGHQKIKEDLAPFSMLGSSISNMFSSFPSMNHPNQTSDSTGETANQAPATDQSQDGSPQADPNAPQQVDQQGVQQSPQ